MKDSREHILQTAFELFMQKSFKEVTMREIVTKTGLSKGAFYHYFESKEQLFMEIIDHFFAGLMSVPFDSFSHESLKAFCADYLKDISKKADTSFVENKDLNANFYFLIFDAVRMIPDFKRKMDVMAEKEVRSWVKIIRIARKKGEIKPLMTDEQIAKFYMYSNDGIGIRMILNNRMGEMKPEIKALWDGFYKQLKG